MCVRMPLERRKQNASTEPPCEYNCRSAPLRPHEPGKVKDPLASTPKTRPCLAGTQAMQHLVRNQPTPSHFSHTIHGYDGELSKFNIARGFFSPSHADPLVNDSSGFGSISDTMASRLSAPGSAQIQRLTPDEIEYVTQKLQDGVRLCDEVSKKPAFDSGASVSLGSRLLRHFGALSPTNQASSQHSVSMTEVELQRSRSLDTSEQASTSCHCCATQHDFAYSTPLNTTTTTTNAGGNAQHLGKDMLMLEENLASAARYVEELTDCESRHASRSSSGTRGTTVDSAPDRPTPMPEAQPGTFRGGEVEVETGRPFHQQEGAGAPPPPSSSTESPVGGRTDVKVVAATTTPSTSAPVSDSEPAGYSSQQISVLSALLQQLSQTDIGLSDSATNELLMALRTSRGSQPQPAPSITKVRQHQQQQQPRVPPTSRKEVTCQVSDSAPHPARAVLRGGGGGAGAGTNPTTATLLSNQSLNLQAALAALSPAALNIILSSLSNPYTVDLLAETRQLLVKAASNQAGLQSSSGNSGLLAVVASLLASNSDEALPTLLSNTSPLMALAATLDSSHGILSGKANNSNGVEGGNTNLRSSKGHFLQGRSVLPSSDLPYSRRSQCPYTCGKQTFSLAHRRASDDLPQMVAPYCQTLSNFEGDIDRAATLYRNSASNVAQRMDVAYQWSGKLPLRNYESMNFSRKVFLGGVPWDSSSDDLIYAFSRFGNVSVLWPQREGYTFCSAHETADRVSTPKGYCYLLFEHESCVCDLLSCCVRDPVSGGDYYKLSGPKLKSKDVQVIPWVISDSQYTPNASLRTDSGNTVFVGALHGMITAEALARIMSSLFGEVTFAALDTDKYKYPIGSGRIVFADNRSYMKAVTANFVEVRTPKFTKTLQIDPFLEDSPCNNCLNSPGIYFCRAFECFRYFCPTCWHQWHNLTESLANHKPLRRSLKPFADRI
nr:unnamed protein product [Spirometra erinaceieuropaei]